MMTNDDWQALKEIGVVCLGILMIVCFLGLSCRAFSWISGCGG